MIKIYTEKRETFLSQNSITFQLIKCSVSFQTYLVDVDHCTTLCLFETLAHFIERLSNGIQT